jgi:hypothetical protein
VKPFSAATVAAPALEVQTARVMPDEKIIALRLIVDTGRIIGCGPAYMSLATTVKILSSPSAPHTDYEQLTYHLLLMRHAAATLSSIKRPSGKTIESEGLGNWMRPVMGDGVGKDISPIPEWP